MASTSSSPPFFSASIGKYMQLAGAAAFLLGLVLSLHHYAIGICFLAGTAAFFIGKKMQAA